MNVWAIGDLHLSFGVPGKSMSKFGDQWVDHANKIAASWKHAVQEEDLVLIPGDISWAMKLEDAMKDLEWIDNLPGKKIISKGNHDYWWPSDQKMRENLPSSIQFVNNNSIRIGDLVIVGARLWDSDEYHFEDYIDWQETKDTKSFTPEEIEKKKLEDRKIFRKELTRLERGLESMPDDASLRIVMTHYPPIGPELLPSTVSKVLEACSIDYCIFGHLHNVKEGMLPFGEKNSVSYLLTSCDYLDFVPKKLCIISR